MPGYTVVMAISLNGDVIAIEVINLNCGTLGGDATGTWGKDAGGKPGVGILVVEGKDMLRADSMGRALTILGGIRNVSRHPGGSPDAVGAFEPPVVGGSGNA